MAESRTFDRAVLDRAEQEIKRQYLARGKYAAAVTSTLTPLERNRVGISIAVVEGDTAKIKSIRIVGKPGVQRKELLDQFELSTPTFMSWYTQERPVLAREARRAISRRCDRSTSTAATSSSHWSHRRSSITPDKEDVHITLAIVEGRQYKVSQDPFRRTSARSGAAFSDADEAARRRQLFR
jgi:outer membrane protein insertion porin family